METPKELSKIILFNERDPSIEARIAWHHQMQETQPIRYRPEYNIWEVFRYKDVQQVLLDYATFSSSKSRPEGFPVALATSEPPEHHRLRGLVSKVFTPHRTEELRPRLTEIVDEFLESAIARGKMNVITELARPLLVRVIAEILGLPLQDQQRFQQWSYQLLDQMMGVSKPDNSELIHYFSDFLDERKRDPRDDLMSALLAAEENGAHLTREEIIAISIELMSAGNLPTTILLGHAFSRLCQDTETYQTLRDDPSLIPGAIEEILRYHFSLVNGWRTALHDTVLCGHEIKAGQRVVAWTGAANFDETYFPHSEQFDIRRSPNPHLTFSYGVHVCLGAPLARLEARIVLERIVARFSEIRLDPEKPVLYMEQMGSPRLIRSLDVLFTPAS